MPHKSNYIMEPLLEMYDTEDLPNGTTPLKFKTIDQYQQEYPGTKPKFKSAKYLKGYFRGDRNSIDMVTYQDKIVIPQKLQKYVVHWYHMYLIHPGMDCIEAVLCQHLFWPGIRPAV